MAYYSFLENDFNSTASILIFYLKNDFNLIALLCDKL